MFTALIATAVFFKFLVPQSRNAALNTILDLAGIALMLAGFLLRITARGYKADHSADGVKLVLGGVYVLTRNPMYLGTFLIGTGVSLFIFNWWAAPLFCLVFLLIYIPQIRKEEKVLSLRFGDEYKLYCQATPRFFPRPLNLFKPGLRENLLFKWRWVKKELPSLLGVIILFAVTSIWKDRKLFGGIRYQERTAELFLFIFCLFIIAAMFYEKENVPKKV